MILQTLSPPRSQWGGVIFANVPSTLPLMADSTHEAMEKIFTLILGLYSMITQETRAEICRLVRSEHFSITKTAKIVGVHHHTVQRVLDMDGKAPIVHRIKKSQLDVYANFITQKIEEYPQIKASTLWRMLKDRAYTGCAQSVRRRVQLLRGGRPKKAFLPITAFPGDEAQVDWAHFGTMKVGRAQRKLSCFVMVLSYSRKLFAKYFFDQTLDSFLAGHVEAFSYFCGVPRQIRYDNLKAAVAERYGQTVRFNGQLLELAAYYAFKPSACNPYSGHEKGRVERSVRYIRESFFVGRSFSTIDHLNTALADWCENVASMRSWPDDRQQRVCDVFAKEQQTLIHLSKQPFSVRQERPVRSGKIPFIRFDKNDYSIPFECTGKTLSLSATFQEVFISDQGSLIAQHKRTYSCGEKVITQQHFARLIESRPGAETVAARAYFTKLFPEASAFFSLMAERGGSLGSATAKFFDLMRTYNSKVVSEAIAQAVSRDYAEMNYIANACEQISRKDKESRVRLPIELPEHLPGANLEVRPHDTATYDEIF